MSDPIDRKKAIECLGDEELFASLVSSFLEEIDNMMVVLEEAVTTGKKAAIKEKAHWVRGGLVYLHAHPSAVAAQQLETVVDEGTGNVSSAYQDLVTEIARLKSFLISTR